MEYLFKNSEGRVTGFEDRIVDKVHWVSLGGGLEKNTIPREALDFVQSPADPRIGARTSHTGTLIEMEWALSPSWHHLSKHWRAYIPVPEHPDLRPEWFFQFGTYSKMSETHDNHFLLDDDLEKEIVCDLNDIEEATKEIYEQPGLGKDNPHPSPFDPEQLRAAHNSQADLE